MQLPTITKSWLAKVLVGSVVLCELLLVFVWSDTQNPGTSTGKQNELRLIKTNVDQELHSLSDAINSASWSSTSEESASGSSEQVHVSAHDMLTSFLNGTGPSTFGIPEFSCLGWRQTGGCKWSGPHEPENDVSCSTTLRAGISGYCLLRDESTGEEVQAMRLNCDSLRLNMDVTFNCDQAADFARVAPQINTLVKAAKQEENQTQVHNEVEFEVKNGIVLVMYPQVLQSVYVTVRLIRSYGCSLPIELWYLESEMGGTQLQESKVLQSLVNDYGPISLQGISENVGGFMTKIYAIAHSKLDQVLFLDADNAPIKDPTYLFSTPEFEKTGAIFWPDYWLPSNTIFNIKPTSLLWELIDLPFTDMIEQESAQVLIDRRRATVAMEIVQYLALRQPNPFERLHVLYGDKDLFRLAWLKTNTTFHMIKTPPAVAGMMGSGHICGMTMVQHDTHGEVLFLHHNGKKVMGDDQHRLWTHLQSFVFPEHLASLSADASERYAYMSTNYHVDMAGAGDAPPGIPFCCWIGNKHNRLVPWESLPYHDMEHRINRLMQEADKLGQ